MVVSRDSKETQLVDEVDEEEDLDGTLSGETQPLDDSEGCDDGDWGKTQLIDSVDATECIGDLERSRAFDEFPEEGGAAEMQLVDEHEDPVATQLAEEYDDTYDETGNDRVSDSGKEDTEILSNGDGLPEFLRSTAEKDVDADADLEKGNFIGNVSSNSIIEENEVMIDSDASTDEEGTEGSKYGRCTEIHCDDGTNNGSKDSYAEKMVLGMTPEDHGNSEKVFAGLSYAQSQEPDELSQAIALGVIDRFIMNNDVSVSQDKEGSKNKAEKVNSLASCKKWAQDLAEKVDHNCSLRKADIFDWVDSQEDEGGGEFFIKRKELLLEGKSLHMKPKKNRAKCRQASSELFADENGKASSNLTKSASLDTKVLIGNCVGTEMDNDTNRKDFLKDIDERENAICDEKQQDGSEDCAYNVGPDTQIAIEAMEALLQGSPASATIRKDETSNSCSHERITCLFSDDGITTTCRRKASLSAASVDEVDAISRESRMNLRSGKCLSDGSTRMKRKNSLSSSKRNVKCLVGKVEQHPPANKQSKRTNPLEGSDVPLKKLSSSSKRSAKSLVGQDKQHLLSSANKQSKQSKPSKGINAPSKKGIDSRKLLDAGAKSLKDKDATAAISRVIISSSRTGKTQDTPECPSAPCGYDCDVDLTTECMLHPPKKRRTKLSLVHHSTSEVQTNLLGKQKTVVPLAQKGSKRKKYSTNGATESLVNHVEARDGVALKTDETLPPGSEDGAKLDKYQSKNVQRPVDIVKEPSMEASPVIKIQNTSKTSTKAKSSVTRELLKLYESNLPQREGYRYLRRRQNSAIVRVLFSRHLDADTIKRQKKIMERFGLSGASFISEATHFVANKFLRTRNMLEAMALGKLIMSPLWLEVCGEAGCLVNEKDYILQDAIKEKEIGFTMTTSLATASRSPLLKGKRVFITPGVKPSREVIHDLVIASSGQPLEGTGRSAVSKYKVSDDLLIISCEEDYELYAPLVKKGARVFRSELLLNGIVIQKLEYERHQLSSNHIRGPPRRST